jgi:hypothetical protein
MAHGVEILASRLEIFARGRTANALTALGEVKGGNTERFFIFHTTAPLKTNPKSNTTIAQTRKGIGFITIIPIYLLYEIFPNT